MLEARGALAESVPHYQAALALRPDDATVENALGAALLSPGKIPTTISPPCSKRAVPWQSPFRTIRLRSLCVLTTQQLKTLWAPLCSRPEKSPLQSRRHARSARCLGRVRSALSGCARSAS